MNRPLRFPPLLAAVLLATAVARADDAPAAAPVVVPVAEDGVQRLKIEMDNYAYSPAHLVVQVGKPVELTFVSLSDWTPHDFVIDDPAFGQTVEVGVGGGKTKTVSFTPTATGTFVFYCSKDVPFAKSHREKGMEGTIEVR
jgi:plastocyanin